MRIFHVRLKPCLGSVIGRLIFAGLTALLLVYFVQTVHGENVDQRIVFENQHKPNSVKGIPGSFVGKSWNDAEKREILALLENFEKIAGGLIQRVTLYRPIRVYRTETGGTAETERTAFAYDETNGIVLRNSFFTRNQPAMLRTFIHEIVHISEVGRRVSRSKEWGNLIYPRINSIRNQLAQSGTTVPAATRTPENEVAIERGLPSMYSATAPGEALAETVTYYLVDRSYKVPEPIKKFITSQLLDPPIGREKAIEAYHVCGEAIDREAYDAGIKACSKSVKEDPGFAGAYLRRAYIWRMKQDTAKAIDDFSKAIERAYTGLDLWYEQRGLTLLESNQCSEAIKDFDKAIEINPESTWAHLSRGLCRNEGGEYAGAYDDFSSAIRFSPKWAYLYVRRGESLRLMEKCTQAVIDYSTAIKLSSKVKLPYEKRAVCRKSMKDYKGSIADYTSLIELEPQDTNYYQERAKVYAIIGSIDEAIADFRQIGRLKPDRSAMMERIIRGMEMRRRPNP